ncbi:bifunctional adenosylcobinamide kinase/adenosylcobinamide-phosphate guanylyltransferase [Gorillibacterium sp. CAU 1737]|uniref:bifunctional adenosylcobinamide kinase/adenosylcobinamide-phosphate guanylyltransferase n=1 Tax=Gorillibacterium sp. CAU 1737 TaxID=3140362 RepID=UPI00326158EE
MLLFITGGARSGKSRFAEACASRLASSGLYVATAQLYDSEMEERARLHQERRASSGFAWTVREEPLVLSELLRHPAAFAAPEFPAPGVILIDCLTLWLTNWLLKLEQEGRVAELLDVIEELGTALAACPLPIIAVSNEVGDGIVPEYPLGRLFRDYAGMLNQRVARQSDRAFLVTAGIPVDLKRLEFPLEDL